MKLRVIVSLIDLRQIDLADVSPGIHPGDLKQLVFVAASREFGEHDEVRIVSVEEMIGADTTPADDAPSRVRISKKLERALAAAEARPDLFPASVTLSRQRLYDALLHQGYKWDSLTLSWQQKEAPNVPTW